MIGNTIENALAPLKGYFSSLTYDGMTGYYTLLIGLYKGWIFQSNDLIECKVIAEDGEGKLIKIFPKKDGITSDDLLLFAKVIIDTNLKIAEEEKRFAQKMEKMKEQLEQEANLFYEELGKMKEKSFKAIKDTTQSSPTKKNPKTKKSDSVENKNNDDAKINEGL